MRYLVITLVLLTGLNSCNKNDDNVEVELNGTFTHVIENCDNSSNPEENCSEFLQFVSNAQVNEILYDGQVNFLYGGSDTADVLFFAIKGTTLSIHEEATSSYALPFTFIIIDDSTLERSDNGDIWKK